MKRVIVLSTLLVFQLNSRLTSAEAFQIYRPRPQSPLGSQNGIDYFRIPTSECGTPDYKCSVFDALSGDQSCNCTCPGKKSTFTSFESKWSCIENSDVRANLQSQQYSKPGEKGNWTKYLPYTLSLLGRMLRNSWPGFDCLPIKIGGSHGAPGHRLPWGEAFSYWVVLFYSYVFNLLCFAP